MKAREKTVLQLGLISWFKKRLSTQRELSPEMLELQLERTEQRNKCQQLEMRLRNTFGVASMISTAFIALWAGVHAFAPDSPSQLAQLVNSEAAWLVAAIQAVTVKPFLSDLLAAQDARSMFMDLVAESKKANAARRSAARSAGQPRSMP